MAVQIVNFSPAYHESHREFAIKSFGNRRKRVNPDYIYWKFRGIPDNELETFLLAIDDDKVIGRTGAIPSTIVIENAEYQCYWICDLMVDPEYRKKGIADMLYRAILEKGLVLGSDPSPAAYKSMVRYGFQELRGPYKAFFPLNLGNLLSKKDKGIPKFFHHLPNPAIVLPSLLSLFVRKSFKALIATEEINSAYQFNPETVLPYIKHDLKYLNWRMNGFAGYQPPGYWFEFKEKTWINSNGSRQRLILSDLFGQDLVFKVLLFANLVHFGYKNGYSEIDFKTWDKVLLRFLRCMGFVKYKTDTVILYRSNDDN